MLSSFSLEWGGEGVEQGMRVRIGGVLIHRIGIHWR